MNFTDTLTLDGLRRTNDGYLVASVKAARTGIQEYRGSEVDPDNLHGMRDKASVRVYRSEQEVFHKDSLASFAHRPVTIEHPPEQVTADNWSKYSVGQTDGEIVRDGQFVRVPMVVMDADAIKIVEAGKRQISQGYSCDIKWGDGVTPDGLKYDAEQVNIRGNHTAIVGLARGGPELKIGDAKMKTVLVDGHNVELGDAAAIAVAGLQAKLADAETKLTAANTQVGTLTAQVSTKDGEIVALNAKLADSVMTPAKLDAAVTSRLKTIDTAKKVFPAVVTDGKTEAEIRKAVVNHKVGDGAAALDDAGVMGAWAVLTADAGKITTDTFSQDYQTMRPDPAGATKVTDARAAMIADMNKPAKAAA